MNKDDGRLFTFKGVLMKLLLLATIGMFSLNSMAGLFTKSVDEKRLDQQEEQVEQNTEAKIENLEKQEEQYSEKADKKLERMEKHNDVKKDNLENMEEKKLEALERQEENLDN